MSSNPLIKTTLALTVAATLNFAIIDAAQAQPLRLPEDKAQKVEDYKPDPKKRLTVAQFVKGANRLHGYLKNAVEKAEGEDKQFLSLEKAEIERQLKDPETALKLQFESIDEQIARLEKLKIFPAPLIAKMRMHYLETEAGKAVGVLVTEKRKPGVSKRVQGEIQYQLGIIAERDQVNFKTALRHYGNAVSHAPTNVEYLTKLADFYVDLGKTADAAKLYKDALAQMKKQSFADKAVKAVKLKLAKVDP